ncbi:MAG: peroxiredoxin family protein [Actinobacteria bacterium]|nr:peroxiredoxin family protein [Actinomycetota bacterium]
MILESLDVSADEFENRTGWAIKPQGACKDERCVPLPQGEFDVRAVAERLGMPVVHDEKNDIYAVGPESGWRVLESAVAPELTLPDWQGSEFTLSAMRGMKVVLLAWASW